jgi:hypothetical protein
MYHSEGVNLDVAVGFFGLGLNGLQASLNLFKQRHLQFGRKGSVPTFAVCFTNGSNAERLCEKTGGRKFGRTTFYLTALLEISIS